MKILIISSFPAPYRVDVFKELNKVYDITVFFETAKDQNRNSEWFSKNSELKFEVLDNKKSINNYNIALKNIKDFDAVLAYDFYLKSAIRVQIECIKNKIPYFINCDGAFINKNFFKKQIKKFFIKRAVGCFASGKHAKEYFMYYGAKEKDIYIHDFTSLYKEDILKEPISKEEKLILKRKLGINADKVVLSIGQFIERKGFDVLLESWKDINHRYELIIIGGGELEDKYKKYIKDNNLSNVKILDFKSKEEVIMYYKAADLFVLPTREDIWGLVINEAMANGLPVITTNRCIAGLELIEEGVNGFIVNINSTKELHERILEILENDILYEIMVKNNIYKLQGNVINNIGINHIRVINNYFNKV